MQAPYYIDGRVEMAPSFLWGSRIGGGTPNLTPPNNAYPPFLCMQNTHDVAIGLTKLWGSHTFKVRIPVAGQPEAAEPRDCDLWRPAVRRQSQFR